MKPRTKLQIEVFGNSKRLPDIEDKILSWAKTHILEHKGFATKTRVICMDCGESFPVELVSRKRAICPHCNAKLKIEQTRKIKDTQSVDLAYASVYGEFQVIRNFELYVYYRANKAPKYYLREILQHWVLPDGKREIVGRYHNMGSCGWCGDMEIRKLTGGSYYSSYKMEMYPYKYHSDSTFKKEYRKYGIDHNLEGMTFLEAINTLPKDPKAETLIKAKQYSLLGYCCDSNKVYHFWPSIKICLRNKYQVKDASMWFDYLDLLEYFKKDLRNAYYVCPKDLHKAHDIYVKRKRRIMDLEKMQRDYISILKYFGEYKKEGFTFPKNLKREYQILSERQKVHQLEKKKKELDKENEKYRKFIRPFLDIQISDKLIRIIPLQSVEDFKMEGDTLHHCVYTNGYYKKADRLVLSARMGDSILETIEIDLKAMKVIQCRGMRNKNSEHHDRILKLVNKNMHSIKERLKPKKNGTKKDVNRIPQAIDMAV
ncbi:MAG: PcfJ domain-containing protein [Prevotella sp.]|jgi:hypothetical protein|nr:PcfJ domain-containing protein [Prevotella sp.]